MKNEMLLVGVGMAEINLPSEFFPAEGFIGIHDALHARVLLLESDVKFAFVSIELTSLPDDILVTLQKSLCDKVRLQRENILISVTHTFSAPHFLPPHVRKSAEDEKKNNLLFESVNNAVVDATDKAALKMQNARFGYGTGLCDVNVNRDMLTADGWWLGINETGQSDKIVSVLRFETLQGKPIGFLYNYSVQPSVMDGSQLFTGGRLISADMVGAASRFLEQEYGGDVIALFCLGAAGDQSPALKAKLQSTDKDGHIRYEDVGEQGFILSEMLGKRLGIAVLRVADKISCQGLRGDIFMEHFTVECPGQQIIDMKSIRPTKTYAFIPGEPRREPVAIFRLGNVAMVGVRPELSALTGTSIREHSLYPNTMIVTMINGGAKYMPDQSAYDRITYEAMNSFFGRGSAESLCAQVVEHLQRQA
jgi:neutral ceramidase